MTNKHPSREECLTLLNHYETPDHVIRHCVKVTETALKIGEALNGKGFHLDLELIQSAGLMHDIARVEEKHWEIGAEIAARLGFYQEAGIIKIHMSYNCNPDRESINETDVICLADRMVKEDEYVGIENRMLSVLEKFKENRKAYETISEKMKCNKTMISRIEKIIGASIDSLMD